MLRARGFDLMCLQVRYIAAFRWTSALRECQEREVLSLDCDVEF